MEYDDFDMLCPYCPAVLASWDYERSSRVWRKDLEFLGDGYYRCPDCKKRFYANAFRSPSSIKEKEKVRL